MKLLQPAKETVKDWIGDRAKVKKPLPDAKTIRRELGMELADAARKSKEQK